MDAATKRQGASFMPFARLLASVLILVVSTVSAGGPGENPIPTADWHVQAKPSVVERNFDINSMDHFLDGLQRSQVVDDNVFREVPILNLRKNFNTRGWQAGVANFKWVDLDADGVYELLMLYCYRADCTSLYIIKKIGKKFGFQEIKTARQDEYIFDRVIRIKDLDNDGHQELILPVYLFNESSGTPVWTAIYKQDGKVFRRADEQFKDFYKKILLPEVDSRIRELDNERLEKPDDPGESKFFEESLASEWVIRDKIARFLGKDPHAGIYRARTWARSPNDYLRYHALVTFRDIKDEVVKGDLQALTADPDMSIAEEAKRALDDLNKSKKNP